MPHPRRLSPAAALIVLGCVSTLSCDAPTEAGMQIPAALEIVSGEDQEGEVGEQLPAPLVVRVLDADDRPIRGVLVNFRVTEGGGSVFAGAGLTDADGVVQERWTLGTVASARQTVEARAVDSRTGDPIVFATFEATALPGPAATLEKVDGDGLELPVGSAVSVLPTVRVADRYDNPVPDVSVAFRIITGGANVDAGTVTSNAEGLARVAAWTLATAAGENRMTATAAGVPPVTFTVRGVAGAASRIAIVVEPPSTTPNGAPLAPPPSVRLVDQHGNPVRQAGVVVAASIASGGGTLQGTAAVATNAEGIAQFTNLAIVGLVGPRTLAFGASAFESATSRPIDVTTGTPYSLTKHAGDGASVLGGTPVPIPPAVRVRDIGGNPIAGVQVSFEVTRGGGSVEPASVSTNGEGIASLSQWTLGATPGPNEVRASVASLAPVTFTATGLAHAAPQMLLNDGDDQSAIVGQLVRVPPSVRVVDTHGNGIPGITVTFAVTGGGGSITGPVTTTDSRGVAGVGSWRLGATQGENTLTASAQGYSPVVFSATALPAMTVTIHQPSSPWVADPMPVEVEVVSSAEITSVVAAIAGRSTALTFDATAGRWRGVIPLDGLPAGSQELVVTATDVYGTSVQARTTVFPTASHQLTIASPLDESVARPRIRVTARCYDPNGPCTRMVVRDQISKTVFAEGVTEVDVEIDVSRYEGAEVWLQVVAYNAAGVAVDGVRRVYVESNPRLQEVVAAPGRVFDTDGSRTLFGTHDSPSAPYRLWILDHASGAITSASGTLTQSGSHLTPRGAMFVSGPANYDLTLYEYVDGALLDHGAFDSGGGFFVEGRYALWKRNGTLYRRDVVSGITTQIGTGNISPGALAENGDVVFSSSASIPDVFRWRNGQITRITSDAAVADERPVTDGINIVYRQRVDGQYRITMHTGSAELPLTSYSSSEVFPGFNYDANGGWVAFRKGSEIWTRSPSGEERRAVPCCLESSGAMVAFGPNGEVVTRGLLHLPPYTSAPIQFANTVFVRGTPFFVGDVLYYRLGRSLFRVVP